MVYSTCSTPKKTLSPNNTVVLQAPTLHHHDLLVLSDTEVGLLWPCNLSTQ
jgi:hypothetical protein